MNKTLTWSVPVAAILAIALAGGADPDNYRSAAADDAIKEHSAEIKRLRAAVAMCGGENAVAQELEDGSFQCFTKRGKKTVTARVDQ